MIIPERLRWSRWLLGFLAALLMAALYVFQRKLFLFQDLAEASSFQYLPFILNRSLRLLLNDSLCLLLFLVIFNSKEELKLASIIFMIEMFLLLPFYFFLKLTLEGDSEISSPLLSFIHRLIVNPLLMIILLAGLLYQKFRVDGK